MLLGKISVKFVYYSCTSTPPLPPVVPSSRMHPHARAEKVSSNAIHGVVPFAGYTAIQSDCRPGHTSRKEMASFCKLNLETVRLAFPEKTKSLCRGLSITIIICSLSVVKWLVESQSE